MKTILITMSGGHLARGIVAALRAAGEFRIVGVDSSKFHLHQSEADEIYLIPRAQSPDFISAISAISRKSKVDFIWPQHDSEIERIAEVANSLPAKTWCPPAEVVRQCRDKFVTFRSLKRAGVPVPETILVRDLESLDDAHLRFGGEMWLRATIGAGGKGAFQPANRDQAKAWLDINDGWGEFTASEFMSGRGDYSWESIWKDGRLVAGQVETRIVRSNPGISLGGVRSRAVLLRDAPNAVTEISKSAVRAMMPEPDGIFRVDLMADSDGIPRVTEVDAGRFGNGGSVYWHQYGYNFAYEAFRLAIDGKPSHPIPLINPLPKDVVSLGGVNQPMRFVKLTDVEAKNQELSQLLEELRPC